MAIPVPVPNTEVKHPYADDTPSRGKVGSRRLFFCPGPFLAARSVPGPAPSPPRPFPLHFAGSRGERPVISIDLGGVVPVISRAAFVTRPPIAVRRPIHTCRCCKFRGHLRHHSWTGKRNVMDICADEFSFCLNVCDDIVFRNFSRGHGGGYASRLNCLN